VTQTDTVQYNPTLLSYRPRVASVQTPPKAAVWFAALGILVLGGDGLYAGITSARPHARAVVTASHGSALTPQQIAAAVPVVPLTQDAAAPAASAAVITPTATASQDRATTPVRAETLPST
jgi:hypothetical protein